LQPLATLNLDSLTYSRPGIDSLAMSFAQPEFQAMCKDLAELGEMRMDYFAQMIQFTQEVEAMGFPVMFGGTSLVSFDAYSDFLRGTFGASTDIYDYPEKVETYLNGLTKIAVRLLKARPVPGKMVFIPMHKGMDGFLSEEHYAKFYWPHLMALVDTIIEMDMTPYVYTEGFYKTRLPFLKTLPKGKCVVHFENLDMAIAKRELGDIACLSGNFPVEFLRNATKQQVIDKVKALLDICAPGGGYIFDIDGGMYGYPPQNVAAMIETVREYGKY
jgi:hypothetical protein